MEEKKENLMTVRDFIDAEDVKGIFLYRKDGYVLGYLRVHFFNLNLKSKAEKRGITDVLTSSFKDDRKDFDYFTLPREIDLDKYKDLLKSMHSNTVDLGKRHILAKMMLEGARLSMSGKNFEHQHFIRIWSKDKNRGRAEDEVRERLKDFKARYASADITTHILDEQNIIKLCNLFGNSLQASFERADRERLYTPIMQLPD